MPKSSTQSFPFAKECMYHALKTLMLKKPYDEITISEITETAGVSRTTYYRNYQDKSDIIRDYLAAYPLGASSVKQYDAEHFSLHDRIQDCYQYLKDNEAFIAKLIEAKLDEILINNYLTIFKGISATRAEENGFKSKYELSALAGICFMVCYDWIKSGMKEPIDEITELSVDIINKYDNLHKEKEHS